MECHKAQGWDQQTETEAGGRDKSEQKDFTGKMEDKTKITKHKGAKLDKHKMAGSLKNIPLELIKLVMSWSSWV